MTHDSPPPDDADDITLAFTLVPVRNRRDGWTEARQRGFIAALKRIGSVTTAARHVGKTRRSAYKLRERPGAESFAAAWDAAADHGRINLHDHVIDRALNGGWTPRFYRGKPTGKAFRYYDGLAQAVLSGRALNLTHALEKAKEQGSRESFFSIEEAWKRDVVDRNQFWAWFLIAEEKLQSLVDHGLLDARWLERDRERKSCPPPHTPAMRPGPRVSVL